MKIDDLKLKPGSKLTISESAAGKTFGLTRARADSARPRLEAELAELQELLYAANKNALLIILQGMDTSGKDGTIKKVMDPVNPVGVHVTAFKAPTTTELAHDFLWRVHSAVPERRMIGIFNRSHYEEVLIVRVHDLVPAKVWKKRYRHIVEFERMLVDSGTIVLKFFLQISRKEQEERLLAREQEVGKAWKLSVADWKEREHWGDYVAAYEDALTKTSTDFAPWYVIPADKKWARNHFIQSAIVETLTPYKTTWNEALGEMGRTAKAELEAFRAAMTK